jgi:hypothetical protein
MIRSKLKVLAVASTLVMGLVAAAHAQNFFFRTDMTGSTGDPGILLTLVSGSGLSMEVDGTGEIPGTMVDGDTRVLTYRNEVSRQITVTSVSVSPSPANFQILSDGCTGAIPVGGQCSVTVRFSANQDGNYTATLNLQAQ